MVTASGELEPAAVVALIAAGLFIFFIVLALLGGLIVCPPMALPMTP